MIVLDTSAALELLLRGPKADRVGERVLSAGLIHAPHLLDVEVAAVLRSYRHNDRLSEERALAALSDLRALGIRRHAHAPFLERAWQLADSVTLADALFLALSEFLPATLVTCDRLFESVPGHQARIDCL